MVATITPHVPSVSSPEVIGREIEKLRIKGLSLLKGEVDPFLFATRTHHSVGKLPTCDRIMDPLEKTWMLFKKEPLRPIFKDVVPSRLRISFSFTREETEAMRRLLSEGVINALTTIMSNKRRDFTGIWYPTDLKIFFLEMGREMPTDYQTGYANPEYFRKTGRYTFELKEGKSASEAVEALFNGPSVLDCGNATQLGFYKAILNALGRDKFDALFSDDSFRLTITQRGITDPKTPIFYFADFTEAAKEKSEGTLGHRPLKIGEECHFKGASFYPYKHPEGFGAGWNVVYVGDTSSGEQLFVAHGFDRPMTEKEINHLLVELYNRDRTPEDEDFIKKSDAPAKYDREANRSLYNFYTLPTAFADSKVEGFLAGSCRGLKADFILIAQRHPIDPLLKMSLIDEKLPH